MAPRWRIRHKLLLGVCLVCGALALLLAGTLRGLWSYYLTMNSIRSKEAELKAAKLFLNEVYDLKVFKTSPEDGGADNSFDRFRDLPKKARDAQKVLEQYEEQLQETLREGRDPTNGEHQRLTVEALKADFNSLSEAAVLLEKPRMDNVGETGVEAKLRQGVAVQIDALVRDADDLYTKINDDINQRIDESREHYQVTLWIVAPAAVVGTLIMAGLMWSFYGWVINPMRDLQNGVKRVAGGDFSRLIEVKSGDEMEDLAAAFNDMTQRLRDLYENLAQQVNERSRQLVRSERLASVGFLAAGVAHEINNPLASILFSSEALEARLGGLAEQLRRLGRQSDDAEVFTRYLRMIQEEAFRCKNITERLLAFSRTGERRREPTDLGKLIQSVLDVTQHLQNARGKSIAFEGGVGKVFAAVNREEIKSVVLNLVVNALDSMEEGGRLTIRLLQRMATAELHFIDTGCGMTQDVLENIFEPFFTRSRSGKGTGLGLTISHSIISQHGGEIEASSAGLDQGSTFIVRLPLQAAEQTAAPPALAA
ncbi:MAG TPA: ATP-binding protein [Gemmataceae bacterium]|nr:ATP-binding protein [Gemmataceae bacterium]